MFKILLTVVLSFFLVACGSPVQKKSIGLDESTLFIVRSESLQGATISIGDSFKKEITKYDLTPYETGIWGAKDRAFEGLETLILKIDAGTHQITIKRNSESVFDKSLYFSIGQTREVMIP